MKNLNKFSLDTDSLVNNPDVRGMLYDKLDVLDRVGQIMFMGDTEFTDKKTVAAYYGVEPNSITKLINRHKEELESNGYKHYTKQEAVEIFGCDTSSHLKINNNGMGLFNKRAILNIGMLLQDSAVAQSVRQELLNGNEFLTVAQKKEAHAREMERIVGIRIRNMFTDTIKEYCPQEDKWVYARYTDIVYKIAFGKTCKQMLKAKGIEKDLRDNLCTTELKDLTRIENAVGTFIMLSKGDHDKIMTLIEEHFGF